MEVALGGRIGLALVVSAGRDDSGAKDQDRACTAPGYALVADGVSTSPGAAEAAQLWADSVAEIFSPEGLQRVCTRLLERREQLLERPLELDAVQRLTPELYVEIARFHRERAFQSTLAACRGSRKNETTVSLQLVICGDSAYFLVASDGAILSTSLRGFDPQTGRFGHAGNTTVALPDDLDALSSWEGDIAVGAEILLCTDGLYDAFDTFTELHAWLKRISGSWRRGDDDDISKEMERLHERLVQRRGDDDIAFVFGPIDQLIEKGKPEERDEKAFL